MLKSITQDRSTVSPEPVVSEMEPLKLATLRYLNTLTEPPVPSLEAVDSPADNEMSPPDNILSVPHGQID
jgi:hypothetical protein